jgi:hypothetical protein
LTSVSEAVGYLTKTKVTVYTCEKIREKLKVKRKKNRVSASTFRGNDI